MIHAGSTFATCLLALALPVASAFATENAARHEIAPGAALPHDLAAGNWSVHLPPDVPVPRGASVVAIDAAGNRVTAPLTRQVHLHLAAPLRSLEWTPSPPPKGYTIETHPAYEPRLVVESKRELLPFASTTEREEIHFTMIGERAGGALPSFAPLPGSARLAVVTSWDDGHANDLRLAELLQRHGYRGTFFMNEFSHARPHDLVALEALGMEIGSHTVNHPRAWAIPPDAWLTECRQMRLGLEAELGHPVVSFAYPFNHTPAYDPHGDYVLRGVREAGYESARTTRTRGESITGYAEPLSFSTDGHFLMAADRFEHAWQRAATAPGGVFYFWGHSSELRTAENWTAFEATLARYARREGAWYATQGQLFLWRWAHAHAQFTVRATQGNVTEVKLTLPRLAPHWRRQLPIDLQVPSGVTAVRFETQLQPVIAGRVSLTPSQPPR